MKPYPKKSEFIQKVEDSFKSSTFNRLKISKPVNKNDDLVELDIAKATFKLLVDDETLNKRTHSIIKHNHNGVGRELFKTFRDSVNTVEKGASIF